MKMKSVKNKANKILLTFIIMIFVVLCIGVPISKAYMFIQDGVLVFIDDKGEFNSADHPKLIYATRGWSFWCSERGTATSKILTAKEVLYKAYVDKNWYYGGYSEDNPYWQYKHDATYGLIPSITNQYSTYAKELALKSNCGLYGVELPKDRWNTSR